MSNPSIKAPIGNGKPPRWQPYPKYKPSGAKWLGDVPEGWDVNKIKYSTYVKGRIGWQGLRSDEFIDEGPYLVTGTDFVKGKINWDSCYHVSDNRYNEDPYIQLRNFDLLITKDGSIGKTAIVEKLLGKATLNSGIFLTRCTDGSYTTDYMHYLLNSDVFSSFIDFKKSGTTINHLYQNVFVNFSYPLPTPLEQTDIATFLDRETARIDALIGKKERQIVLLQEKRAALVSHAVTKGLDPSAKMKDSGIEWLGMVPEHWNIDQLRRVIIKFVDYRGKTPEKVESGRLLITARNIKNGQIDFSLSEEFMKEEDYVAWMVRGFPEIGDVLITTEAPLGEVAQIDNLNIALAQRIILLKVNKSKILNEFLKYQLISDFGKGELWSRATGSTAVGIKAEHLRSILIIVPPLEEQKKIVSHIEKESKILENPVNKIMKSINLLREYRSALVSAAVTGKIDVRQGAKV